MKMRMPAIADNPPDVAARSAFSGPGLGRKADDRGVNALIEYMMAFMISFLVFSMILAMFNGTFIQRPTDAVSSIQFTDVGNDVTAKILDTYLIAPDTGNVSTSFEIPNDIAGKDYSLDICTSQNGWDKEVLVYSSHTNVNATVTINGVNSTIPINGSTSSSFSTHRVKYDS